MTGNTFSYIADCWASPQLITVTDLHLSTMVVVLVPFRVFNNARDSLETAVGRAPGRINIWSHFQMLGASS